jgi:hypothetical protein
MLEFNIYTPELLACYSAEQLGQLTDITSELINNLSPKVGLFANEPLEDKYTVSHFQRYAIPKKLLSSHELLPMNPHLGFGKGMSIADFSCGDGKAIYELVTRQVWSDEFGSEGLNLTLFDKQMPEIEDNLRAHFEPAFQGFRATTNYVGRDLTAPPDTTMEQFDLGIIGFTHYYLLPQTFAYAIAARMAECRVLVVTPATNKLAGGEELDGVILYQDAAGNICSSYQTDRVD